jgi:hypothetical protein
VHHVVKWFWLAGFLSFWIAVLTEHWGLRSQKKYEKDRFW